MQGGVATTVLHGSAATDGRAKSLRIKTAGSRSRSGCAHIASSLHGFLETVAASACAHNLRTAAAKTCWASPPVGREDGRSRKLRAGASSAAAKVMSAG